MKAKLALAALLVSALSAPAFAAESGREPQGSKAEGKKTKASSSSSYVEDDVPWGMAGCSIWNFVIKDKERDAQIGVWALEHFVFGVQTFAISSGTSNCVDRSRHMAQNEQETFVSVNLASLQREAAQGTGEHLDALAEIFGCSEKEGFARMSQGRYDAIFSNEDPSQVVQSYKSELRSSGAACKRAS